MTSDWMLDWPAITDHQCSTLTWLLDLPAVTERWSSTSGPLSCQQSLSVALVALGWSGWVRYRHTWFCRDLKESGWFWIRQTLLHRTSGGLSSQTLIWGCLRACPDGSGLDNSNLAKIWWLQNPAKIFDFRSTRVHGEVDQTSSFTPQSLQGFGWRRFGLVSCAHLVLHHRTPKRPQVVLDTATSSSHHLGYRIFDKLVASISLVRGGNAHDREFAHVIFQRLVALVLAARGKNLGGWADPIICFS